MMHLSRRADVPIAIAFLLCGVSSVGAKADSVNLVEVVENRMQGELVFRRYAAVRDEVPRCRVELEATKRATSPGRFWWWLKLRCVDPAEKSQPTQGPGITRPDGLLFQCLDLFLKDVPEANVWGVDIDLRADHRIWEQVRASLLPVLDRTDGIRDSKYGEPQLAIGTALKKSPEARDLAQRVAQKLNGKLRMWNLNSDGLLSGPEERDTTWRKRRQELYLGLDMSWIPMGILLKPNRGPSE